ncbi:uncharacterized protein MONBRDRAFT_32033 [Monosiga brevicollis MX1]|uniref:Rab-GAP TBC domain-containing protein n=1 Tax=Monosiga brevicollis TaxID=81824 RepID=A9UWY7_MONBE|nr:uncharacterized protein MONBRDRAFT_32033 [Monosiga brevicollis MX1]EDQ90298.1 predicted protein [Monosiga brevicollis MX1]|eukprot:XP_001745065.1 hypothetical protein [Monosiga brevicollis MX1]
MPEAETTAAIAEEVDAFGFTIRPDEAAAAGQGKGSGKRDRRHTKKHLQTVRQREIKWRKMLDLNNFRGGQSRAQVEGLQHEKFRSRSFKGIPDSIRGEAWRAQLVDMDAEQYPTDAELNDAWERFEDLMPAEDTPLYSSFEVIDKDLHRTFPNHEYFRLAALPEQAALQGQAHSSNPNAKTIISGQVEMRGLLRAFAHQHPVPGYCQGMGMIAGLLLMYALRNDAYRMFCSLIRKEKYLLDMFAEGLPRVQLFTGALDWLLQKKLPDVGDHLMGEGLMAVIYGVDWFMCNFAKTLPWTTVLRIWDRYLVDGYYVSFVAAFEIVRLLRPQLLASNDMQQHMTLLRNLPIEVTSESVLIPAMDKSKLRYEDVAAALEANGYKPMPDLPEPRFKPPKPAPTIVQAASAPTQAEPVTSAEADAGAPGAPVRVAVQPTSDSPKHVAAASDENQGLRVVDVDDALPGTASALQPARSTESIISKSESLDLGPSDWV